MNLRLSSYLGICVFLLFVAGCRFLSISDEDIQKIASAAGNTAQAVTATAATPVLPSGAGAGLGAIVGIVVAALAKLGLKSIQKKPE